jgi:hypothetical protein
MSKWQCEKCGSKSPCVLEFIDEDDGFNPTHCPVDGASEIDGPEWKPVEPVTNCNQLPKLTAEVFDRPDCPEWAEWAAVDEDGEAIFFEKMPYTATKICGCFSRDCKDETIPGKFDASDWQNSLIERPEKTTLPEWCKPGAWLWVKSAESYEQIEEIEGRNIICGTIFFEVGAIGKTAFEARVRPWTFEEAPFMVKAKDKNGKIELLRLHIEDSGNFFFRYHGYTDERADFFAKNFTQVDGSPCGVLEHFDPEREEWVK